MAQLTDTIAKAIQTAALATSDAERRDLERSAPSSTLLEWRRAANAKLGAVGCLTGFLGGLWAIAGEAGETAMVIGQARRACHGIGHVLRRDVDYEADMALILAVWTGVAEAARTPIAGRAVVQMRGTRAGAAGDPDVTTLPRSALRGRWTAFARRVARSAAAKIASERAANLPVKWMPMLAAMASAAVNEWVLEGLMDAAEAVYSSEYVVLHDELAASLEIAVDARAA